MTDAAAWLATHATVRADATRFSCLEGCGFCCTYPPQLDEALWKRLERTAGLKQVGLDPSGSLRLPLQGTCGACVLLKDRRCQAYDDRPRHCRLFPFHVYFGRHVEVYANRVCPGLEGGELDLREAIGLATSSIATDELDARAHEAREVHAEFERRARSAGVWTEPDEALAAAARAPSVDAAHWRAALAPFRSERTELLPTMVLDGPEHEWRLWKADDEGRVIDRHRLHEDGSLERMDENVAVPGTAPAPSAAAQAVVSRSLSLECAVGAMCDLVDASGYQVSMPEAAGRLAAEVTSAVALRELLIRAEGLPPTDRWLSAAYEPEFYDLPSIGGWL